MSTLFKTMAASIIAIGLGASGAYAEETQPTTPQQSPQMGSGMQQHGMMGMSGGMMGRSDQNGTAENSGMPNMMGMPGMMHMMNMMSTMTAMMQMNQMMIQMNQMMEQCNRMMASRMQSPDGQPPKPEQPPKG
jgi:hypothetical protein